MRDLYASHTAALRDALRHAVERGGVSSLGVLHQGVPSPSALMGKAANERLHRTIVANVLTYTRETAVSLAKRCGVHRLTVAAHFAIIEAELVGSRHAPGRFDHASERIDTLLRDAGILADSTVSAANDARAQGA